jgi:aspartyl-tRNA(Asn)/glutamyl-tRNA(Gln) amidotransferase subunit C
LRPEASINLGATTSQIEAIAIHELSVAITAEDVLHTAALARLRLDPSEVSRLTEELGRILDYIDQLNEADVTGVPPTEHVALEALPLRPDEPVLGLSHEAALEPAPRVLGNGFAVPGFMED